MAPKKKNDASDEPPKPQTGEGKFYFANGATYDGEWAILPLPEAAEAPAVQPGEEPPPDPRVRQGKGVYIDGDYRYEGEFQGDLMHGKGRFVFASGCVYEGGFSKNQFQGQGTYTWPDGRRYEGEWHENRMHGAGVFVDGEGHQWKGQFFNGSGPGLTCSL